MTEELWRLDAITQAELVASGEVTALELVDAAISRIEATEPAVHALAGTDFERAREKARGKLSGPLAGVPFLVKDAAPYPGLRFSMGSRLFAGNVAREATEYSRRIDGAGLIVLGKSTTSELGLLGSTETLLEGVTHNPWDFSRSAGGSSGGAGAAVASGMVSVAHGSDGGGSIRIPASMNGVFGFKPGRGRLVSAAPDDMGGLVSDHALSVSVADSALLYSLTEVDGAIGFVTDVDPKRLRIGWYDETVLGRKPTAEVRAALDSTIELCRRLGHQVEETPPPPIDGARTDAFFVLAGQALVGLCQMMEPLLGRPLDERDLEPFTLEVLEWFRTLPPGAVTDAHAAISELGADMRRALERFDVLLCPTIPVEPWEVGTMAPTLDRVTAFERIGTLAGYTAIHNIAGTPAMSVPLGMSQRGLPVGSHFAAAEGREATLFSLAYELEEAAPWRRRLPASR